MQQIKQSIIQFDMRLRKGQVQQLRGAIAEKVGYENELFHNHDNSDPTKATRYHHRYPLVQYQETNGLAQVIGLQAGAEALNRLMLQSDGKLKIDNSEAPFLIKDFRSKRLEIGVTDQLHRYELRDWLCIRDKYRKEWEQIDRLSDRIQFLERLLANNIISMARGLGVRFERKFECYITWLGDTPKVVRRRGAYNQLLFHVQWAGNIQLPSYIGLGKGASEGYGRLLSLE